jgi:hypothetical protein
MTVHKDLAAGRWQTFTLVEQMANIGSEVGRALAWRERNPAIAGRAFERALELLDLTLGDPKHRGRLRELSRLRETLADFFAFDNEYASTREAIERYFGAFDNEYASTRESIERYFGAFNHAARLGR